MYGHQVSGYADLQKDGAFRDKLQNLSATDAEYASFSNIQKIAYGEGMHAHSLKVRAERMDKLIATNKIYGGLDHLITQSSFPKGEFNPKKIAAAFEFEAGSSNLYLLRSVDREEKAGISTSTWEEAFRATISRLDELYRGMERAYQFHEKDTTAITARYEQVIGELYDYAKARDNGTDVDPEINQEANAKLRDLRWLGTGPLPLN